MWLVQKKEVKVPQSVKPLLAEKAKQQLHYASRGKFSTPPFTGCGNLQHHGICQLSLQGEQLSSNEAEVEPFMKLVHELMEKKHPTLEQFCNCDKTGLNYTMLPDKTLAAKGESMAKVKQKELMACSNAWKS